MLTIANIEQAAAWDGADGAHWTEQAAYYERSSRRHWDAFMGLAGLAPGDDVLDIGCGTGRSTREAARAVTPGSVLGADLSSAQLDRARRTTSEQGLDNVTYEQADAQVHPFAPESFDIAISSFGVMFFGDPVAAFANIARALRPDGRLAVLAWRGFERNEWLTSFFTALAAGRDLPTPQPGSPGPLGLADPDHVRTVLTDAGFTGVELTSIDEPMTFGTDADDAWAFVSTLGIVKGLTHALDDDARATAIADLRATIDAHDTGDGVWFGSSAWVITARRA